MAEENVNQFLDRIDESYAARERGEASPLADGIDQLNEFNKAYENGTEIIGEYSAAYYDLMREFGSSEEIFRYTGIEAAPEQIKDSLSSIGSTYRLIGQK